MLTFVGRKLDLYRILLDLRKIKLIADYSVGFYSIFVGFNLVIDVISILSLSLPRQIFTLNLDF